MRAIAAAPPPGLNPARAASEKPPASAAYSVGSVKSFADE